MAAHDYSPEQALATLMQKLREKAPLLADEIQAVIDVGKDVEVKAEMEEPAPAVESVNRKQKNKKIKKVRIYRKTVPLNYDEALKIALDALQAYFVELPLFIDSAEDNFNKAPVGKLENDKLVHEQSGTEKDIEIEVQTETQIEKSGPETVPLKRIEADQIAKQKQNIDALRPLIDFTET